MKDGNEHDFAVAAEELAYLRLLHLADSALPIGGLAHSFGLETLVSAGILEVSGLGDFLRGHLQEAGMLEAVTCREAYRLSSAAGTNLFAAQWVDINDYLGAMKCARESRAASAALGRNFLQAILRLGDSPVLQEAWDASLAAKSLIHHAAAFGLVSATFHLPETFAVQAFLHQSTASMVSACQRLLPLGQTAATHILWNLKPVIAEVSARSATHSLEEASCFMPLLDWGAMEHPALSTRLFVS
jgi:urease accessory protein